MARSVSWVRKKALVSFTGPVPDHMTKYQHKAFEEQESSDSKRYWTSKSNDKVEPVRIWLATTSLVDAIKEPLAIASLRLNGEWMIFWTSDRWDVVFASGPRGY